MAALRKEPAHQFRTILVECLVLALKDWERLGKETGNGLFE